MVTSTLDIPYYSQDIVVQAVAVVVLLLGALMTLAGFLTGRRIDTMVGT
ncbi:MAG: hypothetical protein OK452_02355 [Thaumarchaeota archaeon]|nr:hypothetical protein [Nitrososphaerota archaeon]